MQNRTIASAVLAEGDGTAASTEEQPNPFREDALDHSVDVTDLEIDESGQLWASDDAPLSFGDGMLGLATGAVRPSKRMRRNR